MMQATYTIINQWNQHEVSEESREFETIHELEDFLAYNRSYITKLSFSGEIVKAVA